MNPLHIDAPTARGNTRLLLAVSAAIALVVIVSMDQPQPQWSWLALAVAYVAIEARTPHQTGAGWIAVIAMGTGLAAPGALVATLLVAVVSVATHLRAPSVAGVVAGRIVAHLPVVAAVLVVAGPAGSYPSWLAVLAGGVAGGVAAGTSRLVGRLLGDPGPAQDVSVAMERIGLGVLGALLGAVTHAMGPVMAPVSAAGLIIASSMEVARREVETARRATVATLLAAVETKDLYTRGHSERVAVYAGWLGAELGISPRNMGQVRTAALLHDIGKVVVPRRVLRKRGPLSDGERQRIERHVSVVPELLDGVDALAPALPAIARHHLHFAGGGYVGGTVETRWLPVAARILAVADAFDAMTTHRPYRRALSVDYAIAELQRCAGTQFDPEVVAAFVRCLAGRSLPIQRDGFTTDDAARREAERVVAHV